MGNLTRQQRRAKARELAKQLVRQQQQWPEPLETPSQRPEASPRSLWERVRDYPLWWALGALATALTIGTAGWQVFRGPELSLADANATSPFAAPIAAVNNSWPLYMTHARMYCGIRRLKGSISTDITNIVVVFPGEQTLKPGVPAIFQCPILNAGKGSFLQTGETLEGANIEVWVSYNMFRFWARNSDHLELTWFPDSAPPRWITGHFPNKIPPQPPPSKQIVVVSPPNFALNSGIVCFDKPTPDIDAENRAFIGRMVELAHKEGLTKALVMGHIDTAASAGFDAQLANSRAHILKVEVVRAGMPPDAVQIETSGSNKLYDGMSHKELKQLSDTCSAVEFTEE